MYGAAHPDQWPDPPSHEMPFFYFPTILTFVILQAGFLGALLIWLWWRDRSQPAVASWGVAHLMAAAALPMVAARGVIPDILSIDIPNAMVCLAYGLIWRGARQFDGRRADPVITLAGAVMWLFACRIPDFYGNPELRGEWEGLISAAYCAAAAVEFHRGRAAAGLPSRAVLVALLWGAALTHALQAPSVVLSLSMPHGAILPVSPWYGLMTMLGVMFMAGTVILLVALTKEQAELRSNTALAAARDAAAEASDQKTRFLTRMSHELRTPLNGVLGLAQVLARDPALCGRQSRQAATLEQAGRHLLSILNEVLDLSRIEAGRLDLAPCPIALAEFLDETLSLQHDAAQACGVALSLQTAPDLPDAVLADPMRLRQILLNLLNNALKFTPCGGSVTLAVNWAADDDPDDVPDVMALDFTVTDTGAGVPADLRPQLFEDYTQAPGEAMSGGTGLGLAISARLAWAMGGDITHADGPNGRGSRFTLRLTLPAAPMPASPAPEPAPTLPPPGLRILVVDDIAANRMVAEALLRQAGYVVDSAEDGHAALAAILRGPLPDVVLMDQSMPGMDGHTAAHRIRALPGRAGRLPIVALTADAMPEQIAASLAAGMDGHVAKPIDRANLLAGIATALDRATLRMHGTAPV
jgi:signal transduction histidine kinase